MLVLSSYPLPWLAIVTVVICPNELIVTAMSASAPAPVSFILGGFLYPRPASSIVTRTILPFCTTGVSFAGLTSYCTS